ncbi:MAG TPA: M48 family metallopeptidase [Terracidiphilus sp.]|nr:M48 family metallopeptidase [Terracidiphilus sp.]
MRKAFNIPTAKTCTGAAIALAFAIATVAWAAPGPSDPTPHATPDVGAPMDTTTNNNQASAQQAAPCPTSDTAAKSDKKDKHEKKGKNDKKSEQSIDEVEPGTTPVTCDHPGKDFDPEKVVGVGSDMTKVKPGSVADVSAVGNRNIGGRGLGNWYSTESEIKMGKQYADEVDKSARFITDPVVEEYVNRIGQNIVKNSDCKVPFTIKVIDSDEINAFALPGGFFYVNSGLILAADEEAELAGVMAHETAHVCAHHAAREMTRMNYAQLGMVPLILFTGYTWTGYGIYEAAQLAIPITFLQFSRDFEAQADYLGIQYMYRAGYDPQAMISFFEKVEALEKRKPGLVAKAFSDHPQTPDRIIHSQEEIARILPAKDEYLVTTSEFSDVKARLARIENKRRLTTKDLNKPSLRRADNKPSDTSGSGTDTTDRPTLHRRDDSGNGGQN